MWEQRVYKWGSETPRGVYERTDVYIEKLRKNFREALDDDYGQPWVIVVDESDAFMAIWNGDHKEVWVYKRLST